MIIRAPDALPESRALEEPSETELAKDIEGASDEQVSSEGTFFQEQVGRKPKRKHFFSPLDSALAEAVHKDAGQVDYTDAEEVRILDSGSCRRKC